MTAHSRLTLPPHRNPCARPPSLRLFSRAFRARIHSRAAPALVPRSCGICIRARFAALTPFCVSLHLNRPMLRLYTLDGGERGPVIFPAFKAGDSVLSGPNGGFDSHTLPPTCFFSEPYRTALVPNGTFVPIALSAMRSIESRCDCGMT